MKRYIYAMSTSKSDLSAWIEDHTFPVMCALAQLYLFETAQDRNHWKKEVWSNFNQMKRLKSNNKLPSAKFIYQSSWEPNSDCVGDAVKWAINHDESLSPRDDIKLNELHTIMQEYFEWLSIKLSNSIYLDSGEVYNKLDELGLR